MAGFEVSTEEAQSKCEHVANVPLPPKLQKRFHRIYLAKGALATTAIEGNTLSEKEVLAHLEGKLELPPSKEYLAKEIDNIVNAVNELWRDDGKLKRLCVPLVTEFNRRVLDGLAAVDSDVVPGQIRSGSVGVGRYRAAPAEDCEYLLQRLCDWLCSVEFQGQGDMRLPMAVLRAIIAHLYIAWIHPFGDGNGRTARLLEFHILVHSGVPFPSAHLLTNHYHATRTEYYRLLDYASQSGGDIVPFIKYAVRGFVDQLREQVKRIEAVQWDAAWRDFIHAKFKMSSSKAARRRELLLLALSSATETQNRSELLRLTPEVAVAYAAKTAKTLSRDLNALERMNLISVRGDKVEANRNLMRAFAAVRKRPEHSPTSPEKVAT